MFNKINYHQLVFIALLILTISCEKGKPEMDKIQFPTSEFAISTSKDTTLFGEQGTRVFIGAETFLLPDGSMAKGKINIELKELYSKADVLLADLSTKSGDRLLETGGMIYIEATSGGKKLEIDPKKRITVHFPKEKGDSTKMDLFYADGIEKESAVTDWEIDTVNTIQNNKLKLLTYAWVVSSYNNDDTNESYKIEYFSEKGTYWESISSHILSYKFSEQTFNEIKNSAFARDRTDSGYRYGDYGLECKILVSKEGKVKRGEITSMAKDFVGREIYDCLNTFPRLQSRKNKFGKAVETVLWLYIWDNEAIPTHKIDEEYINSFDSKYAEYEKSPIKNMDEAELNYYIFSVSKLGWINCDRFYDAEETTDLFVQNPVNSQTKLKLVFSDIGGILMADIIEGKYVFKKMPVGSKATIIGIKNDDGDMFTAFKEVEISKEPIKELNFTETTLAEFRSQVEKL
ncbi:MAG: hypothetical protein ACI85I_001193 [Arenicella sp.]|jgi:hypothetical protein